ncbi:uncharacterized protein PADG_07974 [Paracoccidioides brasiliensis Pb18]|uniref:WH1 domain-containing protein n=1 Tax=Paracoccidioides brasiliensis (strain Pb18) TaxID=502780 RepID=C1GKW7_PARBD|nr:uncharacterized protein PADG_07974 [Paracoccidioides brasiliensis Pb18]EEH43154.1 hypothetical protein PADG_07974 [Paracoccidioides brasiliensis Pb18]
MPSILSDADKETVRRTVPKPANKILAVAVARLYVAYPNPQKWTYTGLQGAAVLANDLVGHTFWIKLVDVSPAGRGVLWDQEIYDGFSYNQDRTFFHTFELEECLAGLSFADEKEAKTFMKKVLEREKSASRETKATSFGSLRGQGPAPAANGKSHHGLFGGLGNLLHGHGHRSSSAPTTPAESIIPPKPVAPAPAPSPALFPAQAPAGTELPAASLQKQPSPLDTVDPSWKGLLDELLAMGITEDQIAENSDFIKSYIEQKQAAELDGAPTESPPEPQRRAKAPPPPPPPPPPATTGPSLSKAPSLSPQNTGRRAAAPPPPPARRGRPPSPSPTREQSPPPPARDPSPVKPRFKAPPPLADAGKFAHSAPPPPARNRAASGTNLAHPGPPPPPRPPKTPVDGNLGDRKVSAPQLPTRGPILPPRRDVSPGLPPTLPHKVPHGTSGPVSAPPPSPPPRPHASPSAIPQPPPASAPPPARQPPPPVSAPAPPPPPPPPPGPAPSTAVPPPPPPPPPPPSGSAPPPPPHPAPSASHSPPPPLSAPSSSPPPPPPPASGVPPPPPPPAGSGGAPLPSIAAALPKSSPAKDDLLASIRAGTGLRKVKDTEKRDRSAAMVPGTASETPSTPASTGAADPNSMLGSLQAALNKRKQKVSGSDDEKSDDEW